MAPTPSPDALAAEFDCLMARAGITDPAAASVGVARRLCRSARARSRCCMAATAYTAEPSNVFRLSPPGDK